MALGDRLASLKGYMSGSRTAGEVYRLVVEITNACNLRCTMCPRGEMRRKVHPMDRETFEEIIPRNCASLEFVSLNGYGEPLLHPDLFDYLDLCRRYRVPTGISTNCTRLTPDLSKEMLARGPDLLILAVDGLDRERYESVRVGARLEEVLANVDAFLSLREKRRGGPFVVIQCIYMTETRDGIRQFRRYFSRYRGIALRIRQLTFSGGRRQDADYRNSAGPCYWLWAEPMVLSDGTVVPCCQDVNGELAMGNVRDTPLSRLWREGRIARLREAHAGGRRAQIPLCRECNMYQPGLPLAAGAAALHTARLNRLLPAAETLLSSVRYRWNRGKGGE